MNIFWFFDTLEKTQKTYVLNLLGGILNAIDYKLERYTTSIQKDNKKTYLNYYFIKFVEMTNDIFYPKIHKYT